MNNSWWSRRIWLLLLLVAISTTSCKREPELVVSAAASMKDALTAIGRDYSEQNPGIKLSFNFGSSGALKQQIEQGAPVDLFISADDITIDDLAKVKLIDNESRRVIAENVLVLIVPRDSKLPVKGFNDVSSAAVAHVAIGGPTVPAGMRAEEVFTKLGIWEKIKSKAVRGKDVREVLTQVELGNAEAGVVYRTDAVVSNKVRVVATAPASMHKPIRYPLAVVTDSKSKAHAQAFADFLTGKDAKVTLRKFKFVVK